MAQSVCITHPSSLKYSVSAESSSGSWKIENGQIVEWRSDETDQASLATLVIDLGKSLSFNSISLQPDSPNSRLFPNQFSFEMSDDGQVWEGILQEIDFRGSTQSSGEWHFSLVKSRYVRLVCKTGKADNNKFRAACGALKVGIAGVQKIEVSSQLDRLWVKENLFDRRPDYGWSSSLGKADQEEFFLIDLGSVHRVNELRLLTKADDPCCFPDNFVIMASEDDISWHTVLEESHFLAQSGNWYRWRTPAMNIRYVKFISRQGARMADGRFVAQIVEFEMFASPVTLDKAADRMKSESSIPYASVLRSGLVRMARDGEKNSGVAVQGNDRRLREATTDNKGIVELATDGESAENTVVQGNDRRLKKATVENFGIVRLCPDGEYKNDQVVTGNDERLHDSTEDKKGIVQLAKNGESRPGAAVQGSDKRLKAATESSPGIVQLAPDGSTDPLKAIQGNDRRLRDATSEQNGIMRFARSGEDAELAAVQGNDKRLKPATTSSKGIVEWAEDGEDAAFRAVQGNDMRLKPATVEQAGLVQLCPPGQKAEGRVITSDDPRLSDPRRPLEHKHDYAALEHDYSSHTGRLIIKESLSDNTRGVVKPSQDSGAVFISNDGTAAGLTAVGSKTGMRAFGDHNGVIAHGKQNGLYAASIEGPAAILSSQKDFALAIGQGDDYAEKVYGSGKAIKAEGLSEFIGQVQTGGRDERYVATWFHHERRDALSDGDVMVFSEYRDKQALTGKGRKLADLRFAGIYVKKAPLVLGQPGEGEILLAINGLVAAKVEAGRGIKAGDLLVVSGREGHLTRYDQQKMPPAAVCAQAMEPLQGRDGVITVLLR